MESRSAGCLILRVATELSKMGSRNKLFGMMEICSTWIVIFRVVKTVNLLEIIKLHTYNGHISCYVNYISRKLF